MLVIHELEQGSAKWNDLRKKCITATDLSVIMLQNEYKTPYELWKEKLGIKDPEPENEAMRRGKELEPIALSEYCKLKEKNFTPAVVLHDTYNWAMASIDGISNDGLSIVEIKCMGKKNHNEALNGDVKQLYNCQMQWQMFVTGLYECDYFAFSEDSSHIITVKRDQNFINEMIIAAQDFLKCLETITPPKFTDRDYIDRSNDDYLTTLMNHYSLAMKSRKEAETCEEYWKNQVLDYCKKQNTLSANGKITRVVSKGRVKYDAIPELNGVDLDQYRGPDIENFRITITKD